MRNFYIEFIKDSEKYYLNFKEIKTEYIFHDIVNITKKIIQSYNKFSSRDSCNVDFLAYKICKDIKGFGFATVCKRKFEEYYSFLPLDDYDGSICNLSSSADILEESSHVCINFDNAIIDFSFLFKCFNKEQFLEKNNEKSFCDKEDMESIKNIPFNIKELAFCEIEDLSDYTRDFFEDYFFSEDTNKEFPYFINKNIVVYSLNNSAIYNSLDSLKAIMTTVNSFSPSFNTVAESSGTCIKLSVNKSRKSTGCLDFSLV